MRRSKSLQIYLKPGIREDDILLEVWDACVQFDRNQDVFRSILRHGLLAMIESGLMPEAVVDACDLERIAERRKRKNGRRMPEQHLPPQPYPTPYAAQDRHYYGHEEQQYRPNGHYPGHYAPSDEGRFIPRSQNAASYMEAQNHPEPQRQASHPLEAPSPPPDLRRNADAPRPTEPSAAPPRDTAPLDRGEESQRQRRDENPGDEIGTQTQPATKASNDRPKKLGNLM